MSRSSPIPESLKVRIALAFWLGVLALLACGAGIFFRIPQLVLSGLGGIAGGILAYSNRRHLASQARGTQYFLNLAALGIGWIMGAGAILGVLAFVIFAIAMMVTGGPGHGRPLRRWRRIRRARVANTEAWSKVKRP